VTSTILFVPVSGAAGSGEVQRCRLLADALCAQSPAIAPHFLLAEGACEVPWPTTPLSASPTRAVPEVVAAIRALQPDVVVFDGNTRVKAMDAARADGARVVLISSRPSARDRGFRMRRMARLAEHWLVGAELLAHRGWRERLMRSLHPGVAVRRFATLFAPPVSVAPVLARLGVAAPYVVVCPGGGRHMIDGRSGAQLFGEVATQLAREGVATIAVAAAASAPAIDAGELPNAELMALLAHADAALLGGGSLLVQALALGVPVLALPLQREQSERVAWLASAAAVTATSSSDVSTLAAGVRRLLGDAQARANLRQAAAALGLGNGLPEAVAALAALAHVGEAR
jgi:UDP:flavonoid glycosyltransferase YjiC (YdhE family)